MGTDPAPSAGIFFGRALYFFGSKSTISRFGGAFVMVSRVWSIFCLLFFYSRCPCPAICKSEGCTCPRALWSRCHWSSWTLLLYSYYYCNVHLYATYRERTLAADYDIARWLPFCTQPECSNPPDSKYAQASLKAGKQFSHEFISHAVCIASSSS